MHAKGVLHRDIKPANLLVNAQCDLKVCDFGLARIVEGEQRAQPDGLSTLTEYVVTRWYRAPEIMLCCDEYGPAIDVWAVGCVFGEMLLRKALFAGKDYLQQLRMIADGIHLPPMRQIEGFVKNEQALSFLRKLPKEGNRLIQDRLQRAQDSGRGVEASEDAVNLLLRMLAFDPNDRISIDEAMAHPYLAELHGQRWPDEADDEQTEKAENNNLVEHFAESEEDEPEAHLTAAEVGQRLSPQQPQSEKRSEGPSHHGQRRLRANKVGASPHRYEIRPFSSGRPEANPRKPSLLDHTDFHFEKLGALGRVELQDIMMDEIATQFHRELAPFLQSAKKE